MSDQAKRLRDMARHTRRAGGPRAAEVPRSPRIMAVTSGKGGVGKTSFVLNVSIALAAENAQVVVLDADLGLGNIDVMLGIVPGYTLAHVAAGEVGLADIEVAGPGGIKVLPCGSGVSSLLRLPEQERSALVAALGAVEQAADFIIVDTGAGLSPGVAAFLAAAQEIIVITTPEPTAIADAYAAVKVASSQNPAAPVMLVVNMVRDAREALDAAEKITLVARRFISVDVGFLGSIPRDPLVARSVMQQEPFVLRYPSSPAARAVTEIADRLRGGFGQSVAGSGLAGFFRNMALRS